MIGVGKHWDEEVYLLRSVGTVNIRGQCRREGLHADGCFYETERLGRRSVYQVGEARRHGRRSWLGG